ncbi:MAG: hypothetical protein KGJ98_12870 [Chloroflexota bacterium]|nr:hypothetical protein [Chloroflexota bacterium]
MVTVGEIDATKSDEHRCVLLVGRARERFIRYAQLWVAHQLQTVRYLRCRSRRDLDADLKKQSLDVRSLDLFIGGERINVTALRRDVAAWRRTRTLSGVGHVRIAGGRAQRLDAAHAEAIRTLIWCEVAAERYRAALGAFEHGTPVRDPFEGALFPSREGGVLSVDQQQHSWKLHGWTAKGWSPQRLRQHTVQTYERERMRSLAELGPVAGHKTPGVTLGAYASSEPWVKAYVCRTIAQRMLRQSSKETTSAAATQRSSRHRARPVP